MLIREATVEASRAEKKPVFHRVEGGYIMVIDQLGMAFVLHSARGHKRIFKTLDFMVKLSKSLGFDSFEVVGL